VSRDDLVTQLAAAREAAETLAKRPSLGLRAVEPGAGRWYLCAFEGPSFLCLTAELAPEPSMRRTRDAAAASLLHERLEQLVDSGLLRDLAGAVGRALARTDEDAAVCEALGRLAQAALDLAAWRDAPERTIASVPDLDAGSRLHERLRAAYARFVAATDPLVAVQETLDPGRVVGLRGVEEAAGRASVGESLAQRLGATMEDCEDAAALIVAAHITRLHP